VGCSEAVDYSRKHRKITRTAAHIAAPTEYWPV
jgi:hypothetical protein